MRSRADLKTQRDLLAIGEARVGIAKAGLADAEQQHLTCRHAVAQAETRTSDAFGSWSDCIGSRLLGPESVKAAADRLLAAESALLGSRRQLDAAKREADERALEFQRVEARRRAEDDRCARAERKWRAGQDGRRQDDLHDLFLARRLQRQ